MQRAHSTPFRLMRVSQRYRTQRLLRQSAVPLELFGRNDGPSDDWKGGAAPSAENREDTDSEDAAAISEDDLRNAVLSLSDDELIAHDIWFVALGASDFDHAGMREFLSKHRTDIRGAFLITLTALVLVHSPSLRMKELATFAALTVE